MKEACRSSNFINCGGIFLVVAYLLFSPCNMVHARSFEGEGSELLLGVGGRNISRGGAVTASSHDIYATYWNPAGLAEIDRNQLAVSRQIDGSLDPVSFAGIALSHPKLSFSGYKFVLAYSWIPRLHIKAAGKFTASDLESVFTHYALPGLPVDFDGNIESKTREHRFTLAVTPASEPAWSVGINFGRVDCGTEFCGTFAEDPGNYKIASVGATAITVGVGAKYQVSDRVTMGVNVQDLNTTLDVETIVTDANGTTGKIFAAEIPTTVTTGILYQYNDNVDLTLDFQFISGEYSDTEVDFKILRAGYEKRFDNFHYSFGLIVPLTLKSSSDNFIDDLPLPFSPTAGCGWGLDWADIDFAVYPNPLMSYTNDRVEISADLSVIFKF